MLRVLLAVVLALALTGASCQHRPQAPVADADPQCYVPCFPSATDTGVRWDADPEAPEAWDALGGAVLPELAGKALQCERRRQACADCLGSLKQRGVIRVED
jgi:hypothetical protein